MEAVPRLPMLSFELKLSPENTEFGPKLKKYIRDYYHEDPESYQKEIKELEGLRVTAIRVPRDYTGCSTLKRYYSQLFLLQKRFHMTDDGAACVPFMWCDIYSGMVFNITDIKYEQACILYNIGALHSELGAMDTRQTSEGMKISCTHFQCAAWAFQHLRDNFPQPKGSDMSHDLLSFFLHVMLAQAQECILEKSMLDSRKSTIIAKVASQIVEYYKQAQKTLDIGSKNMETGCIADIVGSKLFKAWQKYLQFKMTYHSCVAYMYMGNQSEEQQKMGERLGYLQAALDKLNEAIKLAKHMDKEELSDSLVFTMDVVGGKYEAAKKENEFIYHEKVPTVDTLPEIKGASLVKGIPFQPTDPDVCGPDIFARLVPMETHEASSLYSEEKARILRRVSSELEDKNNELETYLSSLQLEQLKTNIDHDRLPQELVDCCAALSVQPTVVKELIAAMQNLSGVFHDVESALQEIKAILEEEEAKEKVYQELMGKRGPSMILLEMRKELSKYQEAHAKASESNSTLHRAMNLHVANLRLLTGSLEELQKAIPSIKGLDIPNDEGASEELKRLIAKVEEMKSQRAMLENQIREQLQSDDITKRLVAHEGQDMQELFDTELKKHDKLLNTLEQNLSAQDNILRALTQANARCADTRKTTNEVTHKRTEKINSLIASYEAYEDLLAKSQKGLDFYRKLEANVSKLLQRCRGVCKVQEEERQQMLEKSNKKVKGVTAVANPQASLATESGPKLKDYLQYMHPVHGQQINQIQSIMPEMVASAANLPNLPTPVMPATEDIKLAPKPASGLPATSTYSSATQPMYDTPASLAEAVYFPRPAPVGSEQADLLPPQCTSAAAKDYSAATSQPSTGNIYYSDGYPSNYSLGYGQYPSAAPATPTTPTSTPFFSAPQTTAVPSGYYSPSQPPSVSAFAYPQQPTALNQQLPSSNVAQVPVSSAQPSQYPTTISSYPPQTYQGSTIMPASVGPAGPYPAPPHSSYSSYPQAAAAQYPEQSYALPYGVSSQGIYSMPVQSTSGQFYPQQVQSTDSSYHDPNQQRQSAGGESNSQYPYAGFANQSAGDSSMVSKSAGYSQAAGYSMSTTAYQYQQSYPAPQGTYNYGNYGSAPYCLPYSQNGATSTAMQYTQAGAGVAQTCVSSGYYQYSVPLNAEPTLSGSNVQPVASSSVPYSCGDYSTPIPQPVNPQYPQYQSAVPQQQMHSSGYAEPYPQQQASSSYVSYNQAQAYPTMPSQPAITHTTAAPTNGRPALATQTIPSSSVASSTVVPLPSPVAADPNSNIHLLQQLGQLDGAMAASIAPAPAQLPSSSQVLSVEDIHRQQEEMNREAQRSAPKDPYSEPDVLSRFVAEVERFEKVVDGLTKQSLNGPTPLDQKWKELVDTQDKESRKLSISIARCYSMKNRLADVMPYDGTRVHLTATKDDYINASFLKDISQSAAVFIATQAPLPCTFADFWQMVFEQQTEMIVCLTSDAELKVHFYFPNEKNQSLGFGLLNISLQSIKARPWGVERVINIVHTQTRITRVVIHLQCTIWPPSENPALCPFLHLVSDAVNLHQQQRSISRPVVVHCGAGIGRTGVFCLIMAVMEDINAARGIVEIAAVATRMNRMRKFVIQDKEQLRFCYEAVLYYARDLLMKRGILSANPSFEDKLPSTHKPGHSRHPSADFILGLANLSLAAPTDSTKPKCDDTSSSNVEVSSVLVLPNENGVTKDEIMTTPACEPVPVTVSGEETKVVKPDDITDNGSSANASRASSRSNSVASACSSSVVESPQHLSSNLPASLANLDATNFSLDPMPTKGKRKITRESFLNPSGSGLAEPTPDPSDPLSQLDPLWTIHKKGT